MDAFPHQFGEKLFRIVESLSAKTDSVIAESRTERRTDSDCMLHPLWWNIETPATLAGIAKVEISRLWLPRSRNRPLAMSARRTDSTRTVLLRMNPPALPAD